MKSKIGIIAVLVALSVFLYYLWNYTKPENFPINQVKIFATYEHVDKKSIQKTIADYLNSGFFHLDVAGIKKQLLEIPWIYAVSVKRQWPDTIIINVAEQRAVLQWGNKSLINSNGDIFSPEVESFPKNLPVIFGPNGSELEVFKLYQKILTALEPLDLTIKKLVLNQNQHFEILLSNDIVVYLKKDKPLNQIELLVGVYRKITSGEKIAKTFDLRYNTGVAVGFK